MPQSPKWSSIPDPVREPFQALWSEVVRLHWRWELFKQLFVSGPRRVELLNEVAAQFFGELQFVWIDNVVLGLARLLDLARSGKRQVENLSLSLLVERVSALGVHSIEPELEKHLQLLQDRGGPFVKHRHKRIAHTDLEHRLAVEGSSLPNLTPNLIGETLEAIVELMNKVEGHLARSQTAYPLVTSDSGSDAGTLVFALRKAVDWDDLVEEGVIGEERLFAHRFLDA